MPCDSTGLLTLKRDGWKLCDLRELFTLHKWHSNAAELDAVSANKISKTQETYTKQQLGVPQKGKGALLRVPWDKEKDTIEVKFPPESTQPTKKKITNEAGQSLRPPRVGLALNAEWETALPQGL